MEEHSNRWTKIAEHVNELDFASNDIAVVVLDGRKICVARFHDTYYAFPYTCPHAGGILAHGHLDANGHLVCPLHRYRFDLRNGRNVSGEGYYLRHWQVRVSEEGVFMVSP